MKKLLGGFLLLAFVVTASPSYATDSLTCWFPPGWKSKAIQAEVITKALSGGSGLAIRPQIAENYPEILTAFSSDEPNLVYVGSFVQAIIVARKLGTPLVQNFKGREMYSGVLIYPASQDPFTILKNNPAEIAYAIGASSGESSAKAATNGKAAIGVANHGAAVNAVKVGTAKAAVVKNWWWDGNADKFPGMKSFGIPGISVLKNPDNVLTASRAVPADVVQKVQAAALANSAAFGSNAVMLPFTSSKLSFSLGLMQKGGIDPLTYKW